MLSYLLTIPWLAFRQGVGRKEFALLFHFPWSAFRHGHIYGVPITRNPIAWIPYLLALPFMLLVWFLIVLGYVLLLPVALAWMYLSVRSFRRKSGIVSGEGIRFPKAYGRLAIAWPDIRKVIREYEPKVAYYRIICGVAPGGIREYIMSSTPDDNAFERTLNERQIPFTVHSWLDEY